MLSDYFVDGFDKDYNTTDDIQGFEAGEFFRENLLSTRSNLTDKQFRKFAVLDDNGVRVGFLLAMPQTHELPVEFDQKEEKNPLRTKICKDSGNSAFGYGHYEMAIMEYNNAALMAPKEELSVILANRSAAFYHLERYQLALRDCDEALKIGYPQHLLYKLTERRARCLLALKCHCLAMDAFKDAILALDDCKLSSEKKKKLEADMRVMLALMQKGEQLNIKGVERERLIEMEKYRLQERDLAPQFKEPNPIYPACSRVVEIRDAGGDIGRYAVATRDIKPGELIAIERPYCVALLPEYRLTHCHRCTIRLGAPYPANCNNCSSVAYCSPNCRDADAKVHEVECKILGILWSSKASVTCIMALRAVVQQSFDDIVKLKGEIKKDKFQPSKDKPYLSSDYKVFHNLVTHEDERTEDDLFHRAYMAAWLLRVLKTTSYIPDAMKTPDNTDQPLSSGELCVASALLHHIQLLQFNSHEISEFVKPKKRPNVTNGKSVFVAGGVYPTVALFNHSCNPGVIRYFVNDIMIVRAIKSIPAGAEISENYGPIFTEEEENDRKRTLRLQYWFDCNCEACKDHWPLLKDIDPSVLRFKCETGPSCGNILLVNCNTEMFMVPCSKCGKSTNILKGLKAMQDTDALYKTAQRQLEDNKHDEALKSLLEILKILDETLALPIRDYHLCQQDIRKCMLAMGNSANA